MCCCFWFRRQQHARGQSNSNTHIVWYQYLTLTLVFHMFINKTLIITVTIEGNILPFICQRTTTTTKIKESHKNWQIYVQSVLGLVTIKQKHNSFTQLSLYIDLIYLLLVNIRSWYATVNTTLLFPQVKACGLTFYRLIIKPQHVCCYFSIFIKCPMLLSFECYKLLSWSA